MRFVVVSCTRIVKHSCYSCDSWSTKVLTSTDLPDFPLSQSVDFFVYNKNFILKRRRKHPVNASDSEAEKPTPHGRCNALALLRRFEHGAGRESENLFSRPSRSRVCLSKHGEQTIPSKCGSETEHKLHESTRISCDKDNRDNLDNFWEALQVPHSSVTFVPAYSCPSCHSCLLFSLCETFVFEIMLEGHSYLNSFLGFDLRYQISVKRNII